MFCYVKNDLLPIKKKYVDIFVTYQKNIRGYPPPCNGHTSSSVRRAIYTSPEGPVMNFDRFWNSTNLSFNWLCDCPLTRRASLESGNLSKFLLKIITLIQNRRLHSKQQPFFKIVAYIFYRSGSAHSLCCSRDNLDYSGFQISTQQRPHFGSSENYCMGQGLSVTYL